MSVPDEPPPQSFVEHASTNDGIPVAPSMGPAIAASGTERHTSAVSVRTLAISGIACVVALFAALIARLLTGSIALLTNFAFHGRFSAIPTSPAGNDLGAWVIIVPVIGALIVGVMARYGSAAIRGHGIPEAMEQVLFNNSRIGARVLLLKPISAVIAIGTGGPFGAEGPIIATGGALGSLVGQFAKISADERKTLLAAGAGAGMAATFGSPVAAVLLAIELLLFEYRARSLVPVALAAATATGVRIAFEGTDPAFPVRDLTSPPPSALVAYLIVGAVAGLCAVLITKAVYAVEDAFEHLPIHWMWWPAIGAIPVGIMGLISPHTMGVGYDNIDGIVSGDITSVALAVLCSCKFISWLFSLGSGTSGGTLAPLFTIGGGIGAGTAAAIAWIAPSMGVDPRMGALVGMAALFAGASRALLASVVFAFETTRQPFGLLPLLGGCTMAYFLSCFLMRHSIMTEKIARRGRPVPSDYVADSLEQILVGDVALRDVVSFESQRAIRAAQAWFAAGGPETLHQGFPVLADSGRVLGVITRQEILTAAESDAPVATLLSRPPIVVSPESTLREAADIMVREDVGRLPVVQDGRLVGIVTRSDLLEAHRPRILAATKVERMRRIPMKLRGPVSTE